ncbi:MAG: hypothetical protein H6841_08255 [Planctomycetes bacterium]|nr:hypothetical protein [Planctomycetota bacterium]
MDRNGMKWSTLGYLVLLITAFVVGCQSGGRVVSDDGGDPAAKEVFVNSRSEGTSRRPDVGQIGDIKYSLLRLEDFRARHGDGWVEMRGQPIGESPLAELVPLVDGKLPDARGTFLRVHNNDRQDGGNPEKVPVGQYQADAVGPHEHPFVFVPKSPRDKVGEGWLYRGGGGHDRNMLDQTEMARVAGPGAHGDVFKMRAGKNDGVETRPRNVTVYAYVKVR